MNFIGGGGAEVTLILDINFSRLSLNFLRYVPGFLFSQDQSYVYKKVNLNIDSDLEMDTRFIKSLSCKIGE